MKKIMRKKMKVVKEVRRKKLINQINLALKKMR